MRKSAFVLAVAFFLSIGLSAAYADQRDSNINAPSQEVKKKEVKEVASAKDTSMTKEKENYQKKMQGELNGYKKKMKQLEAKAKNLEEKAKGEVKEETAELREKMNVAEQKVKSLKSAMKSSSGEAWEKMKSEVDSAMESVKESYEKVAAHFK